MNDCASAGENQIRGCSLSRAIGAITPQHSQHLIIFVKKSVAIPKPLKREKELVLGKSKGVVHVIVKANSPMLTHIQHLKDVQVSVSLKERE
ncbi:hypothetical protein [Enterococcus faecalis]|uniref:hypothetical protein n=1 Tax=Enterococcus faecalis TaxID=1351 RepID=UPI0018E8B259|nr:hypothetical protein [Enterococcus faecalis]MBJ1510690.1 hypothetical protein [Enterococcus faecalis]